MPEVGGRRASEASGCFTAKPGGVLSFFGVFASAGGGVGRRGLVRAGFGAGRSSRKSHIGRTLSLCVKRENPVKAPRRDRTTPPGGAWPVLRGRTTRQPTGRETGCGDFCIGSVVGG